MRLTELPPDWQERIRAEERAKREALELFVRGCATGDAQVVFDAIDPLLFSGAMKTAFRRVGALGHVPADFRVRFLAFWMSAGDSIRSEVNDDLVLIQALRMLLPPYKGVGVTLYRGESAWNRSRRTYGTSWSAELEVADQWAQRDYLRSAKGGSVVLRTVAPPEAILCAVTHHHDDRYGEAEYVVDRRRLRAVEVVRRYDQR